MTRPRIDIQCPHCKDDLRVTEESFYCDRCSHQFPSVMGIPDLRSFDPPYTDRNEDIRRAHVLSGYYRKMNTRELMQKAYGEFHPEIDRAQLDQFVSQRLQRANLNQQRWRRCKNLMASIGLEYRNHIAIDLGCGVGGMVNVLAKEMDLVIGVEIVMEELILARKYLEERGVDNVVLICSDGESLTIKNESISLVNATSVIEHVRDPGLVIKTVYELLEPGGVFLFDSPNRYDLVYPEPHVGIRFVGIWPRQLQEPFVRLVSGKEYKGKRLLSLRELKGLITRYVPNASHCIFYWPRWQSEAKPHTALGHFALGQIPQILPILNRIWATFVGLHEIIVWRPGSGNPTSVQEVFPMPIDVDL